MVKLIPASDWPEEFGCFPCAVNGRSSDAVVIAQDEDSERGLCGAHAELLDDEEIEFVSGDEEK